MFQKLTPILRVENIEPHLDFWVNRLGFTKVMEVKEGEEVEFVILTLGHIEVMLQTRASLAKDIPALAKGDFCATVLYLGITDLEEFYLLPLKASGIISVLGVALGFIGRGRIRVAAIVWSFLMLGTCVLTFGTSCH